jgi:hypothetical protein
MVSVSGGVLGGLIFRNIESIVMEGIQSLEGSAAAECLRVRAGVE